MVGPSPATPFSFALSPFNLSFNLSKVSIEPISDVAQPLDAVLWLAGARHPVTFVGEADELDRFATPLEGDKHLLGLLDGAAVVLLLMLDQ